MSTKPEKISDLSSANLIAQFDMACIETYNATAQEREAALKKKNDLCAELVKRLSKSETV